MGRVQKQASGEGCWNGRLGCDQVSAGIIWSMHCRFNRGTCSLGWREEMKKLEVGCVIRNWK